MFIQLKNVTKIYRGVNVETVALKNISISFENGEFTAIMGRSGCGKTTLLNILGCMDTFDDGEYIFEDKNIKGCSENALAAFRNKKIGFIFQAFNLINEMTVFKNVEVPLGYAGISAKERKERCEYLLEQVGLSDKLKNHPTQLSGGQQQRVAIARALAMEPAVILADEPTGNLDSKNGTEIMELLKDMNEKGKTIIMVTHDNTLSKYAKRTVTLSDGEIVDDKINAYIK
ncbi:MAG: macrolide transporter ATP-binding protein [Clostridia bacterium]|nr:macrolide transporter ATP-binding protein [Clostridia bacterium]